ncbi:TolC family protein [Thermosulfuriphilus sp.]
MRLILLVWFSLWPVTAFSARLSLEDCLHLALERHPRLKVFRESVSEARARERSAYKDFLPKLWTSYTFTKYRDQTTVVILNRDVPISAKQTYQWQVVLRQPLFHGLALWARHRLAALEADISKVEEVRSRQELIYAVKEAYFRLLEAKRRQQEMFLAQRRLEAHFKDAQAFFTQGLINKADLLQAKVAYLEAKHNLIRATNNLRLAQARLNVLIQEDINAPIEVIDCLDEVVSYPPFKVALDLARKRRPEIVAAKLAIEKAKTGIRLAQSNYYPWLDLTATYQRIGDTADLDRNPYGNTENITFMAEVRWSIFEWGKTADTVSAARSRLRKTEALAQEILDQVTLEVKEAYLGLSEAQERLKLTKASLEQAQENFRLHRERYREQLAATTEVLDAEHLLLVARTNHINALAELHLALARLALAIGLDSLD